MLQVALSFLATCVFGMHAHTHTHSHGFMRTVLLGGLRATQVSLHCPFMVARHHCERASLDPRLRAIFFIYWQPFCKFLYECVSAPPTWFYLGFAASAVTPATPSFTSTLIASLSAQYADTAPTMLLPYLTKYDSVVV